MPTLNFALQDMFGVVLALLLFPSVILFPGYVVGWTVDLLDFRQRQILTRHLIAVLVSMAVTPVLFYLLAFFVSFYAVMLAILGFFILYILIVTTEIRKTNKGWFPKLTNRYSRIALLVAVGWVSISTLLLVDLQWGKHLYNNVVALDFATRATLISAITRTGVPPVNPSFFAGQPEYITSIYYFWYILCSIIDQLGGRFLDSRIALIAGNVWCGLALIAVVALYIRIRNNVTGVAAWKISIIGISLLIVSGFDIIPASVLMLATRFFYGFMWPHGDLEHWNEQITTWVGSLFWVPHHVAALIVCITVFVILQYHWNDSSYKKMSTVIVSGLALASAVGLSVWVTLVFAVFLGVWFIVLLVQNKDKGFFFPFLISGLLALLFASPFLIGLLKGGIGGGDGSFPFAFEVRVFRPAIPFVVALPTTMQNIVYLLLLPINYFMELGFFFVVGVLWFRQYWKREVAPNHFLIPEIILLCVVGFICSFIRSSVVAVNDFGWRGWLLGQFVLLVWATDVNQGISFLPDARGFIRENLAPKQTGIKKWMALMLLIGVSTSVVDVALLRFWPVLVDVNLAGFPNTLSPDTRLGERTFDGRLAYEFINNELPEDVVIQQNPISAVDRIDRPSGLYANRQFAISYNAPFNVPLPVLRERSKQISEIFLLEHQNSWNEIDKLCKQYFIDVLVVNDQDPLWKSIPLLAQQRTVPYQNRYYAVLPCGEFVVRVDPLLENTP